MFLMEDDAKEPINIHIMLNLVLPLLLISLLEKSSILECTTNTVLFKLLVRRVARHHKLMKCFKNWDGPSSPMETDILAEGFKHAEKKYGLRYTTLVGDGDS